MYKSKIVYCLAVEILDTWIEDFIDEDTEEVVSIERNKYSDIEYITRLVIPVSASNLTEKDIENYCDLHFKLHHKNIRFSRILTTKKYNTINRNIVRNSYIPNYKYKRL